MSGPIRIGPDGKPIQEVLATAHPVTGPVSATATVARKIYTFRCSNKSDLFAVSLDPHGSNLPGNICPGEWLSHSEAVVEPGDHIAGFVSRDLFRDLERQGFHLASGVRVTVTRAFEAQVVEVAKALASANASTGFFPTDTDA